jgi:hypothetical protein
MTTLLAACASTPPATPAANTEAAEKTPVGQTKHKWSMASEAEVAAELDRKFERAAKAFVKLKKDDQIMYCKSYKDMGSLIRTLHCITEAELRKQVEDSDQVRDQMRQKMGKCDITSGCGAGG